MKSFGPYAALAGLMLAHSAVQAQQAPFQMQHAGQDPMLTTKPAGALPWQAPAPVQVAPPGGQAQPAPIPFGKPTASQYQPIPEGPHTATAVPVENIDAIEASEPAPATPATDVADPANENPAEPTELTAPIFATEKFAPVRSVHLRVVNKVTGRAQDVTLAPSAVATVGTLTLKGSYCQRSVPTSLPDAAALIDIRELPPGEKQPKALFTGWMYRSSPSVSALEHPVYDVVLVDCVDPKAPEKKEEKPDPKAKKGNKK